MKGKNILVINGHPDPLSFNEAIAKSYVESLQAQKFNVRYLPIHSLNFDPNLRYGFREIMEPEPDLLKAMEDLKWCNHLTWIHPIWWYGFPALMKGFIDRVFLPGFAFNLAADGSVIGYLNDRTARIIATGDTPPELYREEYGESARLQLQNGVLAYCGFSPIQFHYIQPVHSSTPEIRAQWLREVQQLALEDASQGL